MTAESYTIHPSNDDPLLALKAKMSSWGTKRSGRRVASSNTKGENDKFSGNLETSPKFQYSQALSFVSDSPTTSECTPAIVLATLRAVGLPVREQPNTSGILYTDDRSDELDSLDTSFVDPPFDLSGELPPPDLTGRSLLGISEDEDNSTSQERSPTYADEMVDLLCNGGVEDQLHAAAELRRMLGKPSERETVIQAAGLECLVDALKLEHPETLEHVTTAILNLSCDTNLHDEIVDLGAIESLVTVLEIGTSQAQESAAAALYNLSARNSIKEYIAEAGAIPLLINMLATGRRQARKDAALALFSLSLDAPNAWEVVRGGAVPVLVDLLENREFNLEDEAVAALGNLAKTSEGCQEMIVEDCIPLLAEILDVGSPRGQEDAAAVLLLICKHDKECIKIVLAEGVVPSLNLLSRCGRPRARAKAVALLEVCKEAEVE